MGLSENACTTKQSVSSVSVTMLIITEQLQQLKFVPKNLPVNFSTKNSLPHPISMQLPTWCIFRVVFQEE